MRYVIRYNDDGTYNQGIGYPVADIKEASIYELYEGAESVLKLLHPSHNPEIIPYDEILVYDGYKEVPAIAPRYEVIRGIPDVNIPNFSWIWQSEHGNSGWFYCEKLNLVGKPMDENEVYAILIKI